MDVNDALREGVNKISHLFGATVLPFELPSSATRILTIQHREVEAIFKEIRHAGDTAFKTKEQLAATVIEKLKLHTRLEETLFYPEAKRFDKNCILAALEEHANLKLMLKAVSGLSAEDETFPAKITVLEEMVQHHIRDEENELFPKCEKELGEDRLEEIGEEMLAMMQRANAPKKPPQKKGKGKAPTKIKNNARAIR